MAINLNSRQDEIVARLLERGAVDVKTLSTDLGVSEATVRRDLRMLADRRQVQLVYGGATLPTNGDISLKSRALRNPEAKRIIGRLAAELVSDHEMLYVDGGTTCFEMRHLLKQKRGLTVIANSWRFGVELAEPGTSIVQIGGHYRPDREDCVGPLAAEGIDQLRGYVAFISADGLDMDYGLWSNDIETSALYQHVVQNARDTVLLVDHTKFASPSLFKICGWDRVSKLVTDREPPDGWRDFLEQQQIQVVAPHRVIGENGSS